MAGKGLVRVQEKGQVTLPKDVRKKLGLKKGDFVAVTETPEGILITPQHVVAAKTMDRIGSALQEKGLSLDELIEPGNEVKAPVAKESVAKESVVKEQVGKEPATKERKRSRSEASAK